MRTNSDSSGGEAPTGGETPFWIELPLTEPDPPLEKPPEPETGPPGPVSSDEALPAFVAADPAIEAPAVAALAPLEIVEESGDEESGGVAAVIPIILGAALALAIAVGLEAAGLWSTLLPP